MLSGCSANLARACTVLRIPCSALSASPAASAATGDVKPVQSNLDRLKEQEALLDEYIAAAAAQLRELTEQEAGVGRAFVFQDEIRAVSSLQSQTVIALKAPAGTTLEVPGMSCFTLLAADVHRPELAVTRVDPDDAKPNGDRRYQVFLQVKPCVVVQLLELVSYASMLFVVTVCHWGH